MTGPLNDQRVAQAMVAAELRDARPSSTTAAPPGAFVKINGVAQPAGEALRAPMSGAPCVWFRSMNIPTDGLNVNSVPTPRGLPRVLSSTTSLMRGGRSDPSEQRSSAPFVLTDTVGQIVVDTTDAHVDSTIQSQNTRVDGRPWSLTNAGEALTLEWIVPPGQQVFVVGRVTQRSDGTRFLTAPPGGRVIVSTAGEYALQQKAEAFAAGGPVSRMSRAIVLIGLVIGLAVAVAITLSVLNG